MGLTGSDLRNGFKANLTRHDLVIPTRGRFGFDAIGELSHDMHVLRIAAAAIGDCQFICDGEQRVLARMDR